jgi:hypothetical protein
VSVAETLCQTTAAWHLIKAHKLAATAAYLHCSLHWSSTPVLWQQARVDVEGAMPGYTEEGIREHVAICCCDGKVRLQSCKGLQERCLESKVGSTSRLCLKQ